MAASLERQDFLYDLFVWHNGRVIYDVRLIVVAYGGKFQ